MRYLEEHPRDNEANVDSEANADSTS
jgi:hypothetical protein